MNKNQTIKVELTYGDILLIKHAMSLASFTESMRARESMMKGDKPEYHRHGMKRDEYIMFEAVNVDDWMMQYQVETGE